MKTLPTDGRNINFLSQFRKCGKVECGTCRGGQGHGPYIYAYWKENGRTVSMYMGRDKREEAKA